MYKPLFPQTTNIHVHNRAKWFATFLEKTNYMFLQETILTSYKNTLDDMCTTLEQLLCALFCINFCWQQDGGEILQEPK